MINKNTIILQGFITEDFAKVFEYKKEKFYTSKVKVMRSSGVNDIVPIYVSDKLLTDNIKKDSLVRITGEIRTKNTADEFGHTHLQVFVFVKTIYEEQEVPAHEGYSDLNVLELEGYVCKKPVFRTTPLGRELCDMIVAVNSTYGRSYYVPVIIWGRNARFAEKLELGAKILLTGRFQSREYDKNGERKIAYELSCSNIEKVEDTENDA